MCVQVLKPCLAPACRIHVFGGALAKGFRQGCQGNAAQVTGARDAHGSQLLIHLPAHAYAPRGCSDEVSKQQ